MTFYGAGVGTLLGFLYFWISTIVGILLGYIVGTIMGIFEGVLMASLIHLALRTGAQIRDYQHVVGAVNGAFAAAITTWVFYSMLSGVSGPTWTAAGAVVFLVIPALFTGVAAWRASVRTLTWAQAQS